MEKKKKKMVRNEGMALSRLRIATAPIEMIFLSFSSFFEGEVMVHWVWQERPRGSMTGGKSCSSCRKGKKGKVKLKKQKITKKMWKERN